MTTCEVCFAQVNKWDMYKLPLPGRTINVCKKCAAGVRQDLEKQEATNKEARGEG